MKFLNVKENGDYKLAVKHGESVVNLAGAAKELGITVPTSYSELLEQGPTAIANVADLLSSVSGQASYILSESEIDVGPAALPPAKVVCVGLNYLQHAIESGLPVPKEPLLFNKFDNAIAAHKQDVDISGLTQVDYESELAVVIGKQAKRVSTENALDYVLGYCNADDISEREMQFRTGQWMLGKSLDHFLPIGPYLVTTDEIPNPNDLTIKGWLNGELRQDSHTSDMIFSVAECISYISNVMTLKPGDIIITGTPFGVIFGMEEKVWMQPGDEYTVEIEGLGKLSNRMK